MNETEIAKYLLFVFLGLTVISVALKQVFHTFEVWGKFKRLVLKDIYASIENLENGRPKAIDEIYQKIEDEKAEALERERISKQELYEALLEIHCGMIENAKAATPKQAQLLAKHYKRFTASGGEDGFEEWIEQLSRYVNYE